MSFWALGEIVKAHAGILESDDAATAEEKLDAMVETLAEDEASGSGSSATRVPSSASRARNAREREEAFAAWRRLLEAAAEQRPLVLVFEDLHWADDGLLDFVDHLAEWATTVPLLIVGTARPELLDRRPGWGGGKRNAFTLSIGALSDEETAVLLQRLLDRPVLDADAQQAVLQRAEGNPLYAEEYARMLAEHDGGDLPLPETVQGLIAARIDGLAPEEKALLQDASVIGKVFWPGAVPAPTSAASTRSSERSSSAATAAPRSPARRNTPSCTRSSGTSPTARSRARSGPRSTAGLRSGSPRLPATGRRTTQRCSPTTTARRSPSPRLRDSTGRLCVSRRDAPLPRAAQRALSLNAGAAAYELAQEALALTEPGDAKRPALQLLAAYARRDFIKIDVAPLLEEAAEGFLTLGDPAHAAEAYHLLAFDRFHHGDRAESKAASERAMELARSVPLSPASARAVAGHARHVVLTDGEFAAGNRARPRGPRLRRRVRRRPSGDACPEHDRDGSRLRRRRGRRRGSRALRRAR